MQAAGGQQPRAHWRVGMHVKDKITCRSKRSIALGLGLLQLECVHLTNDLAAPGTIETVPPEIFP